MGCLRNLVTQDSQDTVGSLLHQGIAGSADIPGSRGTVALALLLATQVSVATVGSAPPQATADSLATAESPDTRASVDTLGSLVTQASLLHQGTPGSLATLV